MIVRHQTTIDRLLHQPGSDVGQKLYTLGLQTESAAKRLCPVDTGRLRSTITTTNPAQRGGSELFVRIGSNVKYALFVHEGYRRGRRFVRGRPFLRNALNQTVR